MKLTAALKIGAFVAAFAVAPAGAEDLPVRIAFPSGINGQLPKVIEKAGIAEIYGFKPTFSKNFDPASGDIDDQT